MISKRMTRSTTAPLRAMMNMARKRIMTTITMKTMTEKKKSIDSPIRGMKRIKTKMKGMTTTGIAGEMTIMITITGRQTAPMKVAVGAGVLLPMTEDAPLAGRVKAGIRRVISRAAAVRTLAPAARILAQVIRIPAQVGPAQVGPAHLRVVRVRKAGPVPVRAINRIPSSPLTHRVTSPAVEVQTPALDVRTRALVVPIPGLVPIQVPVVRVVPAVRMVAAIPAKAGIRKAISRAAAAGQAMVAGPIRAAATVAATGSHS